MGELRPFVFFVETRFWASVLYLAVALIAIISVNLYIALNKKLLNAASAFLGAVTIPTIFISFLSVSAYVNGLAIWMPPFPIVPVEAIWMVVVLCIVILGFSIIASLEPRMLRKTFGIHRKRQLAPTLLNYAVNPAGDPQDNGKEKGKGGEKE